MGEIYAVVLLIAVLGGCGLDSRSLAERSRSANTKADKTGEPVLDPEAQAVEGFRLWDAEKADERGAVKLWESSCEGGSTLGCTGLGIAYTQGVGGKTKDHKKGFELVEPACEAGVMRACQVVARYYYFGWGRPKDITKGRKLWEQSCEGNVRGACFFLGLALSAPDGPPEWKNEVEAERLFKKACDLGDKDGCEKAKGILTAREITKLREVVKTKWHSFDRDAQCTGKALPPFRKEYEGGTFDQNEKVALYDDCKSPYESRDDALRNTFCCPYEKRK
jgi:hypothetical protein